MENNFELLKASFDRNLTLHESESLNSAVLKSQELQAEARNLQKIRDLFSTQRHRFSPDFVEKVINHLKSGFDRSIDYAFVRIAIPGLAAAVALLLVSMFSGNPTSFDALLGIDFFKPEYFTEFIFYGQ
jgi:hypothetical protein